MKNLRGVAAIVAILLSSLSIGAGAARAQARSDEQPDTTIDAATRKQVVEAVLKQLDESYVFPEVAKKMEDAIRGRMQKKEYDSITSAKDLAQTLTTHLQEVSRDKHLRVRYSHEPIPARAARAEPGAAERERFRQMGKRLNYGFEKVERMPGNIGYLELRGFLDPEEGAETVASAMNFLNNTDSLIIDLRRNGGGTPAMVALISSYLFGSEPVHLNDIYRREDNRTQEFWTLKNVAGKRYEGKDVYVLTSSYTFSGAEEFSYNLKNLKRATIIGETTGGGANPGGMFRLTEHFGAFIPTGRAINPITKTNWEGTGVKPDIDVPADQALKTAHLLAVQKVLEKTTDEPLKNELRRLADTLQKEIAEMKKTPKTTS